jgi:hypothetical protein
MNSSRRADRPAVRIEAHVEAEKGIRLFAREVLPRLREIAPVPVG